MSGRPFRHLIVEMRVFRPGAACPRNKDMNAEELAAQFIVGGRRLCDGGQVQDFKASLGFQEMANEVLTWIRCITTIIRAICLSSD
jgi:hypothetical protein